MPICSTYISCITFCWWRWIDDGDDDDDDKLMMYCCCWWWWWWWVLTSLIPCGYYLTPSSCGPFWLNWPREKFSESCSVIPLPPPLAPPALAILWWKTSPGEILVTRFQKQIERVSCTHVQMIWTRSKGDPTREGQRSLWLFFVISSLYYDEQRVHLDSTFLTSEFHRYS